MRVAVLSVALCWFIATLVNLARLDRTQIMFDPATDGPILMEHRAETTAFPLGSSGLCMTTVGNGPLIAPVYTSCGIRTSTSATFTSTSTVTGRAP